MEQICEMNGVKYDTSHSSDHIEIINDDGESLRIDSSFNLFSDYHFNFYVICPQIISSSFKSHVNEHNFKNQIIYKNKSELSCKLNCSYKSSNSLLSNKLYKTMTNINIAA